MYLDIIATLLIAMFFVFFFYRNRLLSSKLNVKVFGNDPLITGTIVVFTLNVALFVLSVWRISPNYLSMDIGFMKHIIFKVAAVIINTSAITFSIVSSLTLKDSWRVGIHTEERTELICSGIYSKCRNPYYIAYFMLFIGMFIYSAGIVNGLFTLISITIFHILVLREERYLEKVHGETYIQYKSKVRRYFFI